MPPLDFYPDSAKPPVKTPSEAEKLPFYGQTSIELDTHIQAWGWPKFRAKQLRDWVYTKRVEDLSRMTNLSPSDRALFSERFSMSTGQILSDQMSSDGTLKLLIGWPGEGDTEGQPAVVQAETVMIPDADRRTACISSQVGCPVGCKFCASGIGGLKKNLTAAQIVEQVIALNTIMANMQQHQTAAAPVSSPGGLSPQPQIRDQRINHIVFMGMGEPLANYANLMQAIRVLHDPGCLNIGARKITVSTVGVPQKMRQLAEEALPINLAISLHAPTETLRKQLIPWAEHFSLNDILDAARYYFDQTGREITLEYILLAGVNDGAEHAQQLSRLCRNLRVNVNLIRYNEVAGLGFGRPKADDVVSFQEILRANGVNAHVRKSRGRDIDAACGQLRRSVNTDAGLPAHESAPERAISVSDV
jgi:23S rRNA (adenine2503-C2)-methyltransferase